MPYDSAFGYPNIRTRHPFHCQLCSLTAKSSHLIYNHRKRQRRQNRARADELNLLSVVMDRLSRRPGTSHSRYSH
ncbi:Tyrosine-protein kinase receptor old-1 [Clarias magur]|uniref:Tyrosine-protein kinase receptor old-1 n=1 Tax=Clarias magur TaxID=1594786 RepID=A0A8J4UUW3_CLAMG|nr:Tyrosine-protein kinase receptor old-1 [Clarias magur]